MYQIGIATILMYLASVTSFLLGVQYDGFFKPGFALGGLLFVAASAILLFIMRRRIKEREL